MCVQDATVDELYQKVFERMKGDMSSDTNVDAIRLYTAGTYSIEPLRYFIHR